MLKGLKYTFKSLLKKPFKIAMASTQYLKGKDTGGKAIHVYYLCRELAALGCEVHVYTKGEKKSVKTGYIGEGKLVLHQIPTKFGQKMEDGLISAKIQAIMFDTQLVHEIIKEHQRDKFDLIHSHSILTGTLMSKFFNNVKLIHTFHSLEKNRLKFMSEEEKRYFNIESWKESAMNYADAIIAPSQTVKQELLDKYPVKPNKVFKIHNGVDGDLFKPDNIVKTERKVLFIGRFSLEKGIDFLPSIIKTVLENDKKAIFEAIIPVKSSVAEALKSMNYIKRRLERLEKSYPKRFIWHKEGVDRETLAKIYQSSQILIQPSRYESFGLTVLEAMACGKAVLVSNRGGLPEVVDNAGEVLPLNKRAFASEILYLLKNYKLRERYGRRAEERAKKFDWKKIAKQTLDLYKVVTKKDQEEENEKELHEKVHEGLQNLEELHKTEEKIPKVSVIIPAYNAEKYLKESVDSILNQNFKDLEVVVVNDASKDNTLKIANELRKKDKRVKVISYEKNKGRGGAVNVGFENAKGEYITFLDSDDLMYPERLEKQVKFMQAHSGIDMTYGNMVIFQEGKDIKTYDAIEFTKDPKKIMQGFSKLSMEKLKQLPYASAILNKNSFTPAFKNEYIPVASVMFKRKIIDSGIKSDEDLKNSEDYDLWLQIVGAGYKLKKVPIFTFRYRKHPGQKSGNPKKMEIAKEYILKKLKKGKYFRD
jgi:teichuronic acid biosynthesis glycosyltransferase TuaG